MIDIQGKLFCNQYSMVRGSQRYKNNSIVRLRGYGGSAFHYLLYVGLQASHVSINNSKS